MNGKKVERRLGWDCHGLPAEMSAEKQLGVSGRKQIEEYGVEKFNDFCRSDVLKYSGIWVEMFKRIGRWVDFSHDYKTMDLPFMESVINNFKQLWEKGLFMRTTASCLIPGLPKPHCPTSRSIRAIRTRPTMP